MSIEVQNPYVVFKDIDGTALDGGFVFIGEVGEDPEVTPLAVFWDKELTEPATDIRTKNGYPVNGTYPSRLFTAENYSIKIKNKREEVVYATADALGTTAVAGNIPLIDVGDYYASDNVEDAFQEVGADIVSLEASVADKLAKSDPTVDAEVKTLKVNTTADGADTRGAGTIKLDDSGKKIEVSDGENWLPVGSATETGFTLSNGDLVAGVADYIAYDDGAVAEPVDGTGGSPTVTVSLEETEPLIGSQSLLFSKPATDCQGQGFGKDFTIDEGVRGKTTELKLTYKTSDDYVAGDIGMYLYDIDNSTLLYPSVVDMPTADNAGDFFATFITTLTGVNYRLIWHVQTTNALAYTMLVDKIEVGQFNYALGNGHEVYDTGWVANSDWTDVSLIANHSFGVNLSDLAVKFIISKDGSDNTSFEVVIKNTVYDSSTPSNINSSYGYSIFQIDNNSIKIRTSINGISFIDDTGNPTNLDTEAWYYKVVVTKIVKNINLATDFTEYAYNTDVTNSNNLVDFASGLTGISIPLFSTLNIKKRVEWKQPIQKTDTIYVIVFNGTGVVDTRLGGELDTFGYLGYSYNGSTFDGIGVIPVDTYHSDIAFGTSRMPSKDWYTAHGGSHKWLAVKVSNGNMAEVPRMVRAEYKNPVATLADAAKIFDTIIEDTHGAYDNSSGSFLCPASGVLTYGGCFRTTYSGEDLFILNNVTTGEQKYLGAYLGNGSAHPANFSTSMRVSSGDIIQVTSNRSTASNTYGLYRITIELKVEGN